MAVTAHYMIRGREGIPELRARLVAFRKIDGEHSGANMACYMACILSDLKVLDKVCRLHSWCQYFLLNNPDRSFHP
jgi:hypothetical protein